MPQMDLEALAARLADCQSRLELLYDVSIFTRRAA